jgi:hypothetical protein
VRSGIYTFCNEKLHRYLSCQGRKLILSPVPFSWHLKETGGEGFHVYAQDTDLLLDIDNAWVTAGNTIKVWELTGYDVQIWTVAENQNGTYSFLHTADPRYCLGFDGEKAVLQFRRPNSPIQEWKMVCMDDHRSKEYAAFFSKDLRVELQLPLDIERVISRERLQRWAQQLSDAYRSLCELTGFAPYRKIFVEAYKPSKYPDYAGWVFPNSNTICINREFLYGDLAKMNARDNDWNFCALHEMGHMFDFGMPWTFEGELLTDLKVAYVLEANGACAAPAYFDAGTCFRGRDIARAYAILSGDFSESYDIFGCTKRFLEIKDRIGWEPFRKTFRCLYGHKVPATGAERFFLFVRMLSEFSGQDIMAYFSSDEWNAILRYLREKG